MKKYNRSFVRLGTNVRQGHSDQRYALLELFKIKMDRVDAFNALQGFIVRTKGRSILYRARWVSCALWVRFYL
jgi:hypothetical protein